MSPYFQSLRYCSCSSNKISGRKCDHVRMGLPLYELEQVILPYAKLTRAGFSLRISLLQICGSDPDAFCASDRNRRHGDLVAQVQAEVPATPNNAALNEVGFVHRFCVTDNWLLLGHSFSHLRIFHTSLMRFCDSSTKKHLASRQTGDPVLREG